MHYFQQILALLGCVVHPTPPATAAITITPQNPGDLGTAPQVWATQISAPTLTQVKWLVGIQGAKTIAFPFNAPDNNSVPGYNHGDTINFTGYGTGFTIVKDASGPYNFFVQGSNGSDVVTIGTETRVVDIRYTVDGAGGTGPITYTLLNLTNNTGQISATFDRPGDRLIVKSLDETITAVSGPASFSGADVKTITLTPQDPGTLTGAAPQNWTTNVSATGLTQLKWGIFNTGWIGATDPLWTTFNLTNGAYSLTVPFTKADQRLVVKSIDELQEAVSGPATFSVVEKTISLNPAAPGQLAGSPPQTWTTEVTATGMTQVKWVVVRSNWTWVTPEWTIANLDANGKTSIAANFTAGDQRVLVKSIDEAQEAYSGLVSFASVPPTVSDDYQFVYDFRKDLTVGANIERDAGENAGLDQAYFTRLKANGVGHLRFFIMAKPAFGYPSDAAIGRYLDRCAAAIAAGMKIQTIDALDYTTLGDAADSRALPHIRKVATLFKERNFDPRKIAIGACNEYDGENNAAWNGYREDWAAEIRAIVGDSYIVSTGSAYWKDPNHMTDGTMTLIPGRTLYDWHIYPWEAEQQYPADDLKTMVEAWESENSVVSIAGEYAKNSQADGLGNPGPGVNPSWIPDVIYNSVRGYGQARFTYWTITNGTHWRMNNSNNYELTTAIANAMKEADTYVRGRPWFNT